MVDTMMEDAHYLKRHENGIEGQSNHVLKLHRNNIQVGHLLGKGSFSVVSEVKALIGEEREPEHDCTFGSSFSSLDRQSLQDLDGRYAIKHLRPDLVQKPEMFQAAAADLLLEAKYLMALNHPSILKVRALAEGGVSAFEETNGQYDGFFIITDRLRGTLRDKILEWQVLQQEESLLECLPSSLEGTRDELLTGPHLAEQLLLVKLDIAQQIASALEYMHERRLIFRDLKPPNVGMTFDNRVQIFDFGFCRELPSWGGESDLPVLPKGQDDGDDAMYYMSGKGSLMYLAPEVLQFGRYNRKADCYSFAMVLYETLTLNKPFHSVGNIEIFRQLLCQHKARPPLEYSDVPPQLQDLIRHSWDDNVRERWNMRKIHERLQEISRELDPSMPPQQPKEQQSAAPSLSPVSCGAGGFVFDLLSGFAHDLHLGYEILTTGEKTKVLEAHQDQTVVESPPPLEEASEPMSVVQCRDPSDNAEITGSSTAVTEASSILTFASHPYISVNAMTATEEPLEVTLEEAMTMTSWDDSSVDEEFYPDEDPIALDDYEPLTHCASLEPEERAPDERRCPPSPLERTTSAPIEHVGAQYLLPTKTLFHQRRQSMGNIKGGGFYTKSEDLSPHYPPQGRQTAEAHGFNFTKNHFLPTELELGGGAA